MKIRIKRGEKFRTRNISGEKEKNFKQYTVLQYFFHPYPLARWLGELINTHHGPFCRGSCEMISVVKSYYCSQSNKIERCKHFDGNYSYIMWCQNNAENMSSNIVVLAFYYLLVMFALKIHWYLVYYGESDTASRLYKCDKCGRYMSHYLSRSFT